MSDARYWCVLALAACAAAGLAIGAARAQGAAGGAARPLTIATNADPDVLDLTESRDPPTTIATMNNVYEGLIGNNPDGTRYPALATSWDIADGGRTITFHLRRGVKFHSGDAFTAQDVVFSHERELAKAPFYKGDARSIERVETPDDFTVVFHFKQPDAEFIPVHALVIVSKAYHDRVGEEQFTRQPSGTGPYRFVDYTAAEHLTLAAYDGYWGPQPQIRRATFVFAKEDTTRVAKLRAGEVDMVMDTPYSAVADLRKAGFRTMVLPVHPTMGFQFQFANEKAPWHDRRVREAMAHAVDAGAIVKGLLHGLPPHWAMLGPGELGYDAGLEPWRYDPALAKKLMAEAGYPNGFRMPLYYWAGTYSGQQETTEAVALYLKAIGIETKVQGLEGVQLLGLIRKSKDDPNALYVAVAGLPVANLPDPTQGMQLAFFSGSPFALGKDAAFDKAFLAALGTVEDAKRAPLIEAAIRIEHDDLMTIPLWDYVSVYAMNKIYDYKPTVRGLDMLVLRNVSLAR